MASGTSAPQVVPSGLQYAIRILIGTAIAWLSISWIPGIDPLWAIISVVVVTEVEMDSAVLAFKSRVANTVIGCGVGLLFLFLFGAAVWSIFLAMAASVIVCTNLVRVPVSWRIAPITVALVMTPGVLARSRSAGLSIALHRTGEVIFGSAVAVVVSFVAAKLYWRRQAKKGI